MASLKEMILERLVRIEQAAPNCAEDVHALREMLGRMTPRVQSIFARRTGRTTRMLNDAMRQSATGFDVYVVAVSEAQARMLKHQFLELHGDKPRADKVRFGTFHSLFIRRQDELDLHIVGTNRFKAVVLADHFAIEAEYGKLFDMMHRYDE